MFFSLLMFVAVMRTLAAITVLLSTSCPRSLLISSPIAWFPSLCFQQLPTTWWVTSSLHASRHTHTKHTLRRIMKDVLIHSVTKYREELLLFHSHPWNFLFGANSKSTEWFCSMSESFKLVNKETAQFLLHRLSLISRVFQVWWIKSGSP